MICICHRRLFFFRANFFFDGHDSALLDGDHLTLLVGNFGLHHDGFVFADFFAGGLWDFAAFLTLLIGAPFLHLQFSVRCIDHLTLLLETGVSAAIEAAESKGAFGRPLASYCHEIVKRAVHIIFTRGPAWDLTRDLNVMRYA